MLCRWPLLLLLLPLLAGSWPNLSPGIPPLLPPRLTRLASCWEEREGGRGLSVSKQQQAFSSPLPSYCLEWLLLSLTLPRCADAGCLAFIQTRPGLH